MRARNYHGRILPLLDQADHFGKAERPWLAELRRSALAIPSSFKVAWI